MVDEQCTNPSDKNAHGYVDNPVDSEIQNREGKQDGIPENEAAEILELLAQHTVKPDFHYRHKWQQGDVLIWDNCLVQHLSLIHI